MFRGIIFALILCQSLISFQAFAIDSTDPYLVDETPRQKALINFDELSKLLNVLDTVSQQSCPLNAPQSLESVVSTFDCQAKLIYLNQQLKTAVPMEEALTKALKREAQVAFLAERHSDHDYRELVSIMMRKQPEFDCLFLELSSEYQPVIDQYAKRGKNRLLAEIKEINRAKLDGNYAINPDFAEIIEVAKANRLKPFAVDLHSKDLNLEKLGLSVTNPADWRKINSLLLAEAIQRNQFMAKKTAELLSNGTCKKGIFILGKAHVVKTFYDKMIPDSSYPVPDILNIKYSVSSIKIDVVKKNDRREPELRSDPEQQCKWNIKLPGKASFGFIPASPSPILWTAQEASDEDGLVLDPSKAAYYSDFDVMIFLGQSR